MASKPTKEELEYANRLTAAILADENLFIQNFLRIKNKKGQLVPFRYNQVQHLYEQRRSEFDMILKARKMGVSSKIFGGDIWACATKKKEYAVFIGQTQEDVDKIFVEKIKPLIDNSLFPLNVVQRTDYLYFPDTDSRYYIGTAGAKKFGRGSDITRYHLTEVAHWDSPDIITGIEEACIDNAIGRIETTANGTNFFKTMWDAARAGKSRYKAIFFPWFADPEYDMPGANLDSLTEEDRRLIDAFKLPISKIAWRRAKIKSMTQPELFPQEFPATDTEAFLSSGRMVFDWVSLLRHETHVQEPKWRVHLRDQKDRVDVIVDPNGPLRIWQPPKHGHKYFIGADIAEGLEDGAFSVAQVLDLGESEVVAEYHGHIAPDMFGDILDMLGRYYNLASVAPESWPGPGGTTMARLVQLAYPRLWKDVEEKEAGWSTTAKSKPIMILGPEGLSPALRDLKLTIHSAETIAECRSFVYDEKSRMGPGVGCFSDRVMALAIAWHCSRGEAERAQYTNVRVSEIAGGLNKRGDSVTVPRWKGPILGRHAE